MSHLPPTGLQFETLPGGDHHQQRIWLGPWDSLTFYALRPQFEISGSGWGCLGMECFVAQVLRKYRKSHACRQTAEMLLNLWFKCGSHSDYQYCKRLSHGSLIQVDYAVRCTCCIRGSSQCGIPWRPRPTGATARNTTWDCGRRCCAGSSHDTHSCYGRWWRPFCGVGSWHSLHAGGFQRSLQRHQRNCHVWAWLSARGSL